jgi:hypothetical protein
LTRTLFEMHDLHFTAHLRASTAQQESQLTSSDGFSVEKSILQFANTRVSNTNGRTVFNRTGVILRCDLYMLRTATCLSTASPSHSDVATVLPGKNRVIHPSTCLATQRGGSASDSHSRGTRVQVFILSFHLCLQQRSSPVPFPSYKSYIHFLFIQSAAR